MSENHMPEWAKPILESPINIMVGARKCLDASTPHSLPACRDCPFYPWYDCYKILKEQCKCIHAVCGENFRFGAKAMGDSHSLLELMNGNATIVPLLTKGQTSV